MNKIDYRNYDNSVYQYRVERTYRRMIENQSLGYVLDTKAFYIRYPNIKKSIWDVFDLLNTVIDESDPDTNYPQIIHAYQTASAINNIYLKINNRRKLKKIVIKELFSPEEWHYIPFSIKEKYKKYLHEQYAHIKEWDWFSLVGFIHDLGKVLVLKEFGGLPQWSVVGDTFPVGCSYSSKNLFYHKKYHRKNEDYKKYNAYGIYQERCGFEKIHMSYGHDEYFASILEINKTKLPKEAIYIIRFHSFYTWHSPKKSNIRGYTHLANEYDWMMLPLLKAFQKADLYSKKDFKNMKHIKKLFSPLIRKYIGKKELIW